MQGIPSAIAAEQSMIRQNISLSVIKQSAEQDQKVASMLDEALRSAPVSGTQGSNVNIKA